MNTQLYINEVFGPTIQGEGRNAGQLAYFIRLAGCNLHCWWCDTPYTWAWNGRLAVKHKDGKVYTATEERHPMALDDLLKVLPSQDHLIVISGGEPLLQQGGLHALCKALGERGYRVSIETAGTIAPRSWGGTEYGVMWTVSPKLENSGNEKDKRFKLDVLLALDHLYADFKFVVCHERDLDEVEWIQKEVGIANTRMWLMAEGTTSDRREAERKVVDMVLARHWNLSPRTHITLWGDERGR